jgi:hypothetical protein
LAARVVKADRKECKARQAGKAVPVIFGNYIARQGGGMIGLPKGVK